MIDAERRKELAFYLRQLCVGRITNDEFEDAIAKGVSGGYSPEQYYRSKRAKSGMDDSIIEPVLEMCWGLYNDTYEHTLTGRNILSKEALKVIARCILFLHSGKEYLWPSIYLNNPLFRFSLKDILLTILTIGHHYRNKKEEQLIAYYKWQKSGDYNLWPFFIKTDYEEQLKQPPFLNG